MEVTDMKLKTRIRSILGTLKFQLLIPVLLVTVAIVFVLTALVSQAYTQTILDQEDTKIHSAFNFTGNTISERLEKAYVGASSLRLNSHIEFYAAGKFKNDLEKILARRDVLEDLNTILMQQPDIYGILIMREDGTSFGRLPKRNFFTDSDPSAVLNGRLIDDINQGGTWIGPYSTSDFYQFSVSTSIPNQVIMGVRPMHSNAYGKAYALTIVNTQILQNYLDLLTDGRSKIYLTTNNGVELARSGTTSPLSAETWSVIAPSEKKGSMSVSNPSTNERMYICYQKIDSLNWYLICELPLDIYDQTAHNLRMYVWYIAVIVFIAALVILLAWINSFMKIFESLRSAIDSLRSGQLKTRIEKPFRITEFENIRQEFNEMNIALEELMKTTCAMERTQLELELRALQTQLSPHMIFNSITAIRWMSTMMGADRVSDMLLELTEMLRPVFRDWKVQWSLAEELNHLNHYTKLLNLRYGNHFVITYDIPESMSSLKLPRFTFQPLIENACEHGGLNLEILHVSVRGWIENGNVCFSVKDTGCGISPERLADISRHIENGEPSESVGLYNVYNRLRLCMGDETHMRVESPEEGGTHVFFNWPLNE